MKFTPALLAAIGAVSASDKIAIDLYFESKCPGCHAVITQSFPEAFNADGFFEMADVNFFPYGNAHESQQGDTWNFSCQHGAPECAYNLVETCGINKITCPKARFNFLLCVEQNVTSGDYEGTLKKCA